MKLKDADEVFAADLCDPEYAAGYVNISLEEDGIEALLYSLQKVAKARGMTAVDQSSRKFRPLPLTAAPAARRIRDSPQGPAGLSQRRFAFRSSGADARKVSSYERYIPRPPADRI